MFLMFCTRSVQYYIKDHNVKWALPENNLQTSQGLGNPTQYKLQKAIVKERETAVFED